MDLCKLQVDALVVGGSGNQREDKEDDDDDSMPVLSDS